MFGKGKKKEKPVDDTSVVSDAPVKTKKKKKKRGGMGDVFHESVVETANVMFDANDEFKITVGGKELYVGLYLKLEDVGGFDKKSAKDEAKGQIIECINSGKIHTLITADLIEKECMVIIPDSFSIEMMDEFSLLTDAPYHYCYVAPSGEITETDIPATYKQAMAVLNGEMSIQEVLGLQDDEEEEESVQDEYYDDDDLDDESDDDIPDIDAPAEDVSNDDFDNRAAQMQANNDVIPSSNPQDDVTPLPQQDTYQQEEAAVEEQPAEPEVTIPPDWTKDAVIRHFYSDELGLEISTEPFDAQFMHQNTYTPFDENRPSDWLNDQLNEMSRDANVEMERLHNNNLFVMRERYFRLISMHCDRIRADLDIHDGKTQYGQMYSQLMQSKVDELSNVDHTVSAKKQEMEAVWNQQLEEVGEAAAADAKRKYRERYGMQHSKDISNLEVIVKSDIEADFKEQEFELQQQRRMEASKLLDLGITEVLDEISDAYTSTLKEEHARYTELWNNMLRFRDDNRQASIAHANALAEELRQTDKADAVLAEQTARMRMMTDDFEQKKRDLTDEIARIHDENKVRLAEMKHDTDARIARVEEEKAELQKQFDDLLVNYQTLDAKKAQEYEARMAEVRDETRSWEMKCNHVMELHKRSNLTSTFLLIAGIIAALAIGFIGGEYINVSNNVKKEQAQIISQYQQMQQQNADTTEED